MKKPGHARFVALRNDLPERRGIPRSAIQRITEAGERRVSYNYVDHAYDHRFPMTPAQNEGKRAANEQASSAPAPGLDQHPAYASRSWRKSAVNEQAIDRSISANGPQADRAVSGQKDADSQRPASSQPRAPWQPGGTTKTYSWGSQKDAQGPADR